MENKPKARLYYDNQTLMLVPPVDESGASLPYNGSSGWSGTDTSKDRAERADSDGRTRSTQNQTVGHLYLERERGMTWREIAEITGWHHGTVSGALSVLHKAGKICRLLEKRNRCRVYVLPEYVNGRETDEQGRKHTCPECGHKF